MHINKCLKIEHKMITNIQSYMGFFLFLSPKAKTAKATSQISQKNISSILTLHGGIFFFFNFKNNIFDGLLGIFGLT